MDNNLEYNVKINGHWVSLSRKQSIELTNMLGNHFAIGVQETIQSHGEAVQAIKTLMTIFNISAKELSND